MFSGFLEFFKKPVQYNIYGNDYRTFVIGFGGIQFGRGLFTVLDKANALVLEKSWDMLFRNTKGPSGSSASTGWEDASPYLRTMKIR